MPPDPSRVWQRAAVYGSLWAAGEIVVGSFLHNLSVPFAGTVLAAFGVTVMTAGHRATPERGLIWRAALICALMKSISPSAVILGPMIGIAMEGVLLEASVRLAGGHPVGYLIGGALAVSWSLAQRILNSLITFGPDVVRLYVETYNFAARSLGVSRFGPFDLIATLIVVEWAVGVAAAGFGMWVGRHASQQPAAPGDLRASHAPASGGPIVVDGDWSLPRLAVMSAALLIGMVVLALAPLWCGLVYVLGFAAFVLRTYPRAAARIRRPSMWIEMAAIMLLAGLLLGGVRSGAAGMLAGAAAGAAMVIRATMMLVGFTAISVELRNPTIMSWVERRRMRGLSDALGAAFGTLPAFTAALAQQRRAWRHPTRILTELLRLANGLITVRADRSGTRRVVILTGRTGSGKTTLATEAIARLRDRGRTVGGVLAPGLLVDGRRTGFDLVNLATGESAALARETPPVEGRHAQWARFSFSPQGLALGARALGSEAHACDIVVVDEVGPFELAGGGWADALDALARDFPGVMLLVVRATIVDAVRARWGSPETVIYNVEQGNPDRLASLLSGDQGPPGTQVSVSTGPMPSV